jgi:hypothetical protein
MEANEHMAKLGTTIAPGNHHGAWIHGIKDFA